MRSLEELLKESVSRDTPSEVVGWILNRLERGEAFPWSGIHLRAKHKESGRQRLIRGPQDDLKKGERLIGSLKAPDELLLRALERQVSDAFDPTFSNSSYAYRKNGLTQRQALRRFYEQVLVRKQYRYVVKLDLRNFFGNVPHARVLRALQERGMEDRSITLISGFLKHANRLSPGSVPRKGLLQGASISGVLANISLDPLDQSLEALAIPFIRFCDDITLLANSSEELERSLKLALQALEKLGFELNLEKTLRFSVLPAGPEYSDRFELLGFEFERDGRYRIRERTMKKAHLRLKEMVKAARRERLSRLSAFDRESARKVLKQLIHRVHLYLGYEHRKDGEPRYRLSKPDRTGYHGWVRCWTSLPYSEEIDLQLQGLDSEFRRSLGELRKEAAPGLRSAVSAYRTLAREAFQPLD